MTDDKKKKKMEKIFTGLYSPFFKNFFTGGTSPGSESPPRQKETVNTGSRIRVHYYYK